MAEEKQRIHPGLKLAHDFAISEEMMDTYAHLSGDHHRVHADNDYARSRGFKSRIVYGGLLVAQVSRLIGAELPAEHCVWTRLTIDFRTPLYVGETATLSAEVLNVTEAVNVLDLKFTIKAGQRLLAKGAAEVVFAHE